MKKNLTGRIRTIDLGITIVNFYSPPLYQLSYGEFTIFLQTTKHTFKKIVSGSGGIRTHASEETRT